MLSRNSFNHITGKNEVSFSLQHIRKSNIKLHDNPQMKIHTNMIYEHDVKIINELTANGIKQYVKIPVIAIGRVYPGMKRPLCIFILIDHF